MLWRGLGCWPRLHLTAARALAKRQKGDEEGALADEEKSKELIPDEKPNSAGNNFDDLYKGVII
jgi:hypothetical protein